MRKFSLIAPALIAALGLTALPAQAAPRDWHQDARQESRYDGRHNDDGRYTPARDAQIRADIRSLDRAIDRAAARRTVSNREAASLRRESAQVQRLYASYARNGLSRTELRTLQNRVDRIRLALRTDKRDWNNRRG
ncbi:hypothetical protein [Novosphingobium sp. M1R2S20]|uniref:Uncharacterized protein n=1 Tax=Novosphingobium rhizovicinum TaxID=3228928 RepID=A0ABV3RBD4_9SPHN